MTLNGLDISKETQKISYNYIKDNNIEFVMLRAGFTDYNKSKSKNIDEDFEYNYKLAKKYKLKVGVYYTSRAVSLKEAEEEINYFLDIIKGKIFEYPVCIQIEDDHNTIIYYPINQKKLESKKLFDISLYMINKLKERGYETMIRTYYDWYNNIFKNNIETKYFIDNAELDGNYIISNKDNNHLYLKNKEEKVEVVLVENCLFSKVKSYVKAGYKILKSKIRKN